jgi:Deoxyribonuclease NucA/NucB
MARRRRGSAGWTSDIGSRSALRALLAVAIALLSLGATSLSPAAQAEVPTLESSLNFHEALERVKEQTGDDGGSIDDLASTLSEHPDSETEVDLDRYLAEIDFLNHDYGDDGGVNEALSRLGLSSDTAFVKYGETELEGMPNSQVIEELAAKLNETVEDTSTDGSTELAAGGEMADEAANVGIFGAVGGTIGAVSGVLVLGGLTYLDIKNGTNPASEFLVNMFTTQEEGPVEPTRTSASEHLVTSSEGAWHYITQCSAKILWNCISHQNTLEKERADEGGPSPWPEWYGSKQEEPYGYSPVQAAYNVGEWHGLPGAYVFAWKVGADYYYGSTYPTLGGGAPIYNLENDCKDSTGAVAAMYGWNSIAGLPSSMPDTYFYDEPNEETWTCEPFEMEGPPGEERFHYFHVEGDNRAWYAYRSPAQMKMSFGRHGSKEAAELEGATVIETTGTPVAGAASLEKALAQQAGRGGDGEAEAAVEHGEHVKIKSKVPKAPGTENVPSCVTLTVAECESALKEKGFASVSTETVGWGEANLSEEPGQVIGTTPAAGGEAETSKKITIKRNPEATSREKVAEALRVNNPKTELSTEEAKDIAEYCLKDGASIEECETLPIFISGSDVATATEHDLKALVTHPEWAMLNYESKTAKEEKGIDRYWYIGEPGCEMTKPPEGESCDEYPLFSTRQGGPGASLEYINAADNGRQGGKYGNFVTICKMAERVSTDYRFLALPIPPVLGVPTISNLCNAGPE